MERARYISFVTRSARCTRGGYFNLRQILILKFTLRVCFVPRVIYLRLHIFNASLYYIVYKGLPTSFMLYIHAVLVI